MTDAKARQRSATLRLAAALIALGSACLGVKAAAILVTGDQPPVLFEIAGLPLGAGLLLLARWSIAMHGASRRLTVAAALSFIAALASASGASMEILSQTTSRPLESVLAVGGGLIPLVATLLIGLRLRALPGKTPRVGSRALLIVIAFAPLMVLGGIAADVAGERYLEVGLVATAALWLLLAHAMWIGDGSQAAKQGVV